MVVSLPSSRELVLSISLDKHALSYLVAIGRHFAQGEGFVFGETTNDFKAKIESKMKGYKHRGSTDYAVGTCIPT